MIHIGEREREREKYIENLLKRNKSVTKVTRVQLLPTYTTAANEAPSLPWFRHFLSGPPKGGPR